MVQADDMPELVGDRALEVLGVGFEQLRMDHEVTPGEVVGIDLQVSIQDLAAVGELEHGGDGQSVRVIAGGVVGILGQGISAPLVLAEDQSIVVVHAHRTGDIGDRHHGEDHVGTSIDPIERGLTPRRACRFGCIKVALRIRFGRRGTQGKLHGHARRFPCCQRALLGHRADVGGSRQGQGGQACHNKGHHQDGSVFHGSCPGSPRV